MTKRKNRVKDYLNLPYATYVVPDVTTENEPCYVASHPELSGCMSHGNTPEEAIQNLVEATELYISALLDMGLDVPTPMPTPVQIEITWNPANQLSFIEQEAYMPPSITPLIFATVP